MQHTSNWFQRLILTIQLAGLLTACALSQTASAQSTGLTCRDPSSSLLWEIRGEHSQVFLFGSIHLGNRSFYPLHQTIETALQGSDYVVFEVDPQEMLNPNTVLKMQQLGQLPAGQSLNQILSPAVLNDLREQLTKLGLPTESFMQLRPWMVTLALSSMQMMAMGYAPDQGVESYVTRRQSPDAQVLALETMDSQIAHLQALDGEAFLAYTLANFEASSARFQELVDAWRCADKAALEQLFEEEFAVEGPLANKMQELQESLLFERNRQMAEKIKSYVREGKGQYFVVVGAAHFIGEKNIIDLLKHRGYRVKPVELD